MHIGSFRLGAGAGIIFISAVFYIGTIFLAPAKEIVTEPAAPAEYSDEDVIERARKLGMIFIKELPQSNNGAITDEEVIRRAEELGYYLVSDVLAQQYPGEEGTEEDEPEEDGTEEEPDEANGQTEAAGGIADDGTVVVRIISGENSIEIARKLHDRGVVDDARAFNNYVTLNNKTRRLITGDYTFSLNMEYEQVLNILTHKKQ